LYWCYAYLSYSIKTIWFPMCDLSGMVHDIINIENGRWRQDNGSRWNSVPHLNTLRGCYWNVIFIIILTIIIILLSSLWTLWQMKAFRISLQRFMLDVMFCAGFHLDSNWFKIVLTAIFLNFSLLGYMPTQMYIRLLLQKQQNHSAMNSRYELIHFIVPPNTLNL